MFETTLPIREYTDPKTINVEEIKYIPSRAIIAWGNFHLEGWKITLKSGQEYMFTVDDGNRLLSENEEYFKNLHKNEWPKNLGKLIKDCDNPNLTIQLALPNHLIAYDIKTNDKEKILYEVCESKERNKYNLMIRFILKDKYAHDCGLENCFVGLNLNLDNVENLMADSKKEWNLVTPVGSLMEEFKCRGFKCSIGGINEMGFIFKVEKNNKHIHIQFCQFSKENTFVLPCPPEKESAEIGEARYVATDYFYR